ncbi:MAG: hypothetical protein AB2556_19650, partial [Candidatus Thiodiazotropha sp.]
LDGRGVQVVCCGDQVQPRAPPIAGEMLHECLLRRADYYEEVIQDHRAKEPKALKREIRLQPESTVSGYEKSATRLSWMGRIHGSLAAR